MIINSIFFFVAVAGIGLAVFVTVRADRKKTTRSKKNAHK